MINGKLQGIVNLSLWLLLIGHMIVFEILHINSIGFVVTGSVIVLCIALQYALFMYTYIKSHKKVLQLQDQYIETLKPDKPLRFCPTDDELIQTHLEKIEQSTKINEGIIPEEQNTNEDCLELEME